MENYRNTTQYLMPGLKEAQTGEGYDIYPAHKLNPGVISFDLNLLAQKMALQETATVDGYTGVFFEHFREQMDIEFRALGKKVQWTNIEEAYKPEEEINQLIKPFMGEESSIFGTRATICLVDFLDEGKVKILPKNPDADIHIVYGPGASLAKWNGSLVYIDLPKNEIQFRARAGSVRNLGASQSSDMKTTYKRYYFIDWVVLNKHKKEILEKIDVVVDGQQADIFPWMEGQQLRKGLQEMAVNLFRVRPWFEPGVWGGSWMKGKLRGLNPEAKNYAWSFELISPENGIIFESSGKLLEVSFDFLMYAEGSAVMGADHDRYGDEFPLRFDFLDTIDGGNLSVQCHPRPEYCRENFGETITQEETYYILDSVENAKVYLGFQENIHPEEFEATLWESYNANRPIDITRYVQELPARKHDLFLIPPGTIHASGTGSLVLEISTTPYIFTFKMYDWVRPDLDGKPRPLNIGHGMKNLFFDRKGDMVKKELISEPRMVSKGSDWVLYELPTHEKHSYRVNRYHFHSEIIIETKGKCHVLNLVEGTAITVRSEYGLNGRIHYAETFVVPAAAKSYTITNHSEMEAKVVLAFMK